MGSWSDFNDAQSNTNLIPKGTLAKVRLTIRPGGFDDPSQGWTGGYATRGSTGAVYLNGEFTVLEGPYARRKVWSLIGLYSPKGPDWANMGRGLNRGILNSARGVSDKDNSPEAQARRRINGFGDLDGVEFVARIEKETGDAAPAFSVEPKLDGLAISLRYEDGVFVRGATEGINLVAQCWAETQLKSGDRILL